jgi:hypothetical protein
MGLLVGAALGFIFIGIGAIRTRRAVREAFNEGAQLAIDNAAMKASDMGHPEVREEINSMWARGRY